MARFPVFSVTLLILLGAAPAHARPPEDTKVPVFADGWAKVPHGKRAQLDVSGETHMKIVWKEGEWEFPYARVRTLYVSLSRPSEALVAAAATYGVSLLWVKGKKCYLSMSVEDSDGYLRSIYFLIPEGSGLGALETLKKRSNANLVFESVEARRRIEGIK